MTAGQAVAEAQTTYDDLTDPLGLVLCQQVHDDLCMDYPLIKETIENTAMVAGTAEYTLGQQVVGVRSAAWVRSSAQTDFIPLEPLDADELDAYDSGWRYRQTSTPYGFLLDGGYIRLVQAPDISSTGGYPRLRYEALKTSTLLTGTALPTTLASHQVYVTGIRMKWAEKRDKSNYEMWYALWTDELARLERYMGKRNRRHVKQFSAQSYMETCI